MAVLTPGTQAPDFWLSDPKGDRRQLGEMLQRGPAFLFFYKTSCPTCQLMAPFVEKMQVAFGSSAQIVGIAQDGPAKVRDFVAYCDLSFQQLCEEAPFPVSSRFGLTHVPTVFLIGADGTVLEAMVGWDREKFNQLGEVVANWAGREPFELAGAEAPVFKAG